MSERSEFDLALSKFQSFLGFGAGRWNIFLYFLFIHPETAAQPLLYHNYFIPHIITYYSTLHMGDDRLMTDDHITAIVVAMLTNRYVVPENDNEKMAKEVAKVYRILKEKTIPDKYRSDEDSTQ